MLTAGPDAAGSRIDQWLASELAPDLSRARIQALVKSGAVTADGKPATEPKMKLAGGETIRILIPEPEPAAPAGDLGQPRVVPRRIQQSVGQ